MKKFLLPITELFKRSNSRYSYNFGFELINSSAQFNNYYKDKEKFAAVISNPALLKVFSLQCDLFSMAEVYIKDQNGEYLESHPFLDWIKKPNPFQTQQQFLWDFMFWEMIGNAYCYVDNRNLNLPNNFAYFLTPYKIEWPFWFDLNKDKLVFSNSKIREIESKQIDYVYDDGSRFVFPKEKLLISNDLSNGTGNFYKSSSRIDALYKIISNSEYALDSKNINIRFAGKYMVGAKRTTDIMGLTDDEKKDIKENINKQDKNVYPMGALAEVKRFVENIANLQLDQAFLHDYFIIGTMYGIPKDILESHISGSTYENQEKAIGRHVSYTLNPKGDEFASMYNNYFRLSDSGLKICLGWEHLPFMQVFEKERADVTKTKVDTIKTLIELGISLQEAKKIVDLE
jgi:hypothetical protein